MKSLVSCTAALLAITSLFGASSPKKDPCCIPNVGHEIQECQAVKGAYNTPASFDFGRCWKGSLSADFIYWQAREDNLALGVVNFASTAFSPPIGAHVLNMDFSWNPGVKVGLGLGLSQNDNWDLFFEWTHLVSHSNTSASAPIQNIDNPQGSVNTSLVPPDFAFLAHIANGTWKLLYNTIDGNLGRPYYSGKMLTFRPHIGLRGAWFHQTLDTSYGNIFVIGAPPLQVTNHTKFNSWGIGPRVGVESNWILGKGFSFYGNTAFSLLYTYFDVKETTTLYDPGLFFITTPVGVSAIQNKNRNSQVRSNAEAALGFSWGSYFGCNQWHIDFTLGYEFQYWFNANQNLQFLDDSAQGIHTSRGDLALHGATFSLKLDF